MQIFSKTFTKVLSSLGFKKSFDTRSSILGTASMMEARKGLKAYSGWVFACVRAISWSVADIEYILKKRNSKGEEETLIESPVLNLLRRPNEDMSGWEMLILIMAHLELTGDAYLYLDVTNEQGKNPTALYVMAPSEVSVVRDTNDPRQPVTAYKWGTKEKGIEPYKVIHLKNPNPLDVRNGLGTVQGIDEWIDTDLFMNIYNQMFFKNGAKLAGLLKPKAKLTTDQMKVLKQTFEQLYARVDKAHSVGVLPQETDYQELGTSRKDLDFSEGSRDMRDKILAGFGVPKSVLGIVEDVNRANAEASNYIFALRVVRPRMKMLIQQLQDKLVSRFDDSLVLTFVDPVPENRELIIEEQKAATGSQPVMSINEARQKYHGLGPIENGDAVMTDFNKVALGNPVKIDEKTAVHMEKGVKTCPTRGNIRHNRKMKLLDSIDKATAKAEKAVEHTVHRVRKNKELLPMNISNMEDGQYEKSAWEPFVTRVGPHERQIKKTIVDITERQFEDILTALHTEEKAFELEDENIDSQVDILMRAEEYTKEVIAAVMIVQMQLFKEETIAAGELLGLQPRDYLTTEAKASIESSVELMAEKYSETTRKELIAQFTEAVAEGEGLKEVIDRVESIKAFATQIRAERVAKTEAFRIANVATRTTWKESGVVKSLKWFTAADERTCEFCGPLHGEIKKIDEGFFEKGEVVTGSEGGTRKLDYADVVNPPLHPNCRCYLKPHDISIEE